ncbi:MAG TPA: dipeptide/oligopeptide/nickel ABC transporter ATP-binding protein [Acetobacteraceae bacterium]|nr:dipeptide/oligopeptide/nickel ABC transporter ATP-binding protein [Acetobacteraceae bacterium]
MSALLKVRNLKRHFESRRGFLSAGARPVRAVDDVSFAVGRGEVLGLVGESGSGKSTIANLVLRLDEPTAGTILFEHEDITRASERQLAGFRRRAQPIFQDPFGSLDPRMTVGQTIAEPLVIHGLARSRTARRERVVELLRLVGLHADHVSRFPHQFSGGQRSRIGIARAIPATFCRTEATS